MWGGGKVVFASATIYPKQSGFALFAVDHLLTLFAKLEGV
jgi:hypothetical protein